MSASADIVLYGVVLGRTSSYSAVTAEREEIRSRLRDK
jgi:hypothetical protein